MSGCLKTLLRKAISDPEAGWSMGSFGAIAEFHQDDSDTIQRDSPEELTRATMRGAIRIDCSKLGDIQPIAFEVLSPQPDRWSHALALCLPIVSVQSHQRNVLTKIGPDKNAICAQDEDAILFDMGLGLNQCDFYVRTKDPDLIDIMSANVGRSLFDHSNPAMSAILQSHPHRIAVTGLGRVEVYQKIGGPDTGGVSPPGPHTHVLPKLIKSGRTHSANAPIPNSVFPCAYLHPGNPVVDTMGKDRPFDVALLKNFETLMECYAPRYVLNVKKDVMKGIEAGIAPDALSTSSGRQSRAAIRVTLRQLARQADDTQNSDLTRQIALWRAHFDSVPMTRDDDDEAMVAKHS